MRRQTKSVFAGTVEIGGQAPIAIQTMWDRPLSPNGQEAIEKSAELKALGCSLIRFGVPKLEDAEQLGALAGKLAMPAVADIHFDYKIALRCLDFPIAKLRLNPGNIGAPWKAEEVARKAKDTGVPIRIGVNGGSLPAAFKNRSDRAAAMVECALAEAEILEKCGFNSIVISLKDSEPEYVLEAVRQLAAACSYPLHLGITEAGPLLPAVVQSSFYLGKLLEEGIGDTLRISISDDIRYEVTVARHLLAIAAKESAPPMPKLISCPLCARNSFDTHAFVKRLEPKLYSMRAKLTAAVMGCVVNGPGEAAHADIAISGAGNRVFVYKKGLLAFSGSSEEAEAFFWAELEKMQSL